MDPPDDDIQFDFFDDEPVTAEAPQRTRVPRVTRKPRGPSSSGPHHTKPLLRLALLVGCFVFLLLVFALLISSCAGESKKSTYGNYMDKVATIASQSSTDGANTVKALTTPSRRTRVAFAPRRACQRVPPATIAAGSSSVSRNSK